MLNLSFNVFSSYLYKLFSYLNLIMTYNISRIIISQEVVAHISVKTEAHRVHITNELKRVCKESFKNSTERVQ